MNTTKRMLAAALATLSLLALAGCQAKPSNDTPPTVKVTELWSTQDADAINNPESAWYDAERERIWVINTTDGASPDAFVSALNTDGSVAEPMVAGGFTALRGSYLSDGFLYVNQASAVSKIDLDAGTAVATYPAEGATALNDITMDSDGNVYSSDTQFNTIYVLEGDKMVPFLTDEATEWPNGLLGMGDQLLIAPWGAGDLATWQVDYASCVKVLDLESKKIEDLGSADAIGSLDGIEKFDDNNILVGNWWEGKVYLVNLNSGASSLILDTGLMSMGDINYNAETQTLLLPIGNAAGDESHQIKAYKIELAS